MSTSDAAGSPFPLAVDEKVQMTIPRRVQSCVMCQQRKVKCNREFPCSHCIRLGSECVKSVPAPPRRKKRKVPQSELTAKIRHYERLLKGQRATIHGEEDGENKRGTDTNDTDTNGGDENGDEMEVEAIPMTISSAHPDDAPEGKRPASPVSPRRVQGRLISGRGLSTYVDNTLWASLTDELRDPKDHIQKSPEEERQSSPMPINRYAQGGALLFSLSLPVPSLTKFHPPPVHIFKLWQTYLDNVNPLSKIIHTPTVQRHVLEAAGNLDNVPKPMEALMFTVYAAAVNSMEEGECENTLGETKAILFARYLIAAQEALIRASVLKTHDIVVLQAFTIFLLSIRESYDPNTLWVLTGAAVRICQRLGVHRDGTKLGLSVFETELRRRLCWQLALLDSRSAQLSGVGASLTNSIWDAKMPLNVNDSDISPEMREAPIEYEGLTEMVFCLIRYEFGHFLRDYSDKSGFDGHWENLSTATGSLAEKDRKIEELERLLEHKFIKHCDPLVPLHALSIAVARSAICKVRLLCHHPRQYADNGASMPQSEKDLLAINSLEIMEQDSSGRSMASMKRFFWHINCYFQFDAFIFLVHDLRQRTQGELAERAWQQVQQVYFNHPILATDADSPLYCAIGNLTLKAWNAKEAECMRINGQVPPTPYYISLLRDQRFTRPIDNNSPAFQAGGCASIQQGNGRLRIPSISALASYDPNPHSNFMQHQYQHSGTANPPNAGPSTNAYGQNLVGPSYPPNNNANYAQNQYQNQNQISMPAQGQGEQVGQMQGRQQDPNSGFDDEDDDDRDVEQDEDFQPDESALDWAYWHDLMAANERYISEEGGSKIFV